MTIAEDNWKTTFYTEHRLFKYAVRAFRFTNACELFTEMMHTIFKDIEKYTWYLNNILTCGSKTEEEH